MAALHGGEEAVAAIHHPLADTAVQRGEREGQADGRVELQIDGGDGFVAQAGVGSRPERADVLRGDGEDGGGEGLAIDAHAVFIGL